MQTDYDSPSGTAMKALRQKMRETPEGKLLIRYGFEPYDTETSARRVAEKAAVEIEVLRAACEQAQTFIRASRHRFPKSIRHSDKFALEQTCAALGSALHTISPK